MGERACARHSKVGYLCWDVGSLCVHECDRRWWSSNVGWGEGCYEDAIGDVQGSRR